MNRPLPLLFLILLACNPRPSSVEDQPKVMIAGAMRNVMQKGQLQGVISLDTLSESQPWYGIGPEEYLRGELLLLDGQTYRSSLVDDSVMTVEKTNRVKAPFFVYARVDRWKKLTLPDSVFSLKQLENFLNILGAEINEPFPFRLTGVIAEAHIHVVNLPEGTPVNSPQDSHRGKRSFTLRSTESTLLGFYSQHHQSIFTHHDSYVHVHFIDHRKENMGHLDELQLSPGAMILEVPEHLKL